MAFALTPDPQQQFLDPNGVPYAAGKLYTYVAGTTTPVTVFTDASGQLPHQNPIILDAFGSCTIYLPTNPSMKFKYVLHDWNDVPVRTWDDIILEIANLPGGPPVPNLNADFLDGLDSTDFVRKPTSGSPVVPFLNADLLDGIDSTGFVKVGTPGGPVVPNLNADLLDGIDSTGFLKTPVSGSPVVPFLNANLLEGYPSGRFIWNPITTSQAGLVHNWNPNSALLVGQPTQLRLEPPANLQITGFIAGAAGQFLVVKNYGPSTVQFFDKHASSAAGNRLWLMATSGTTWLASGGAAIFQYDAGGGYWCLLAHEQGDFITMPHNPANFVAITAGTWSVPAANTFIKYQLRGRVLQFQLSLAQTTITGARTYLAVGNLPYALVGGAPPLQTALAITQSVPRYEVCLVQGAGIPQFPGQVGILFVRPDSSFWPNGLADFNGLFFAHVL